MAKETGLHFTQISRMWRAHGLKPDRVKTFKLFRNRGFRSTCNLTAMIDLMHGKLPDLQPI